MEFVSKSERICRRGRLVGIIMYRYAKTGDDFEKTLEDASSAFYEGCKNGLARRSFESGKCLRASFVCDKELRVEISITLGEQIIAQRVFECALPEKNGGDTD